MPCMPDQEPKISVNRQAIHTVQIRSEKKNNSTPYFTSHASVTCVNLDGSGTYFPKAIAKPPMDMTK